MIRVKNKDMASAEMPGASSKTITPVSTSKKQGHLVAGRRKLEEYRKKKAEEKRPGEKHKTTEKPVTSDFPEEGTFANGSGLGAIGEGGAKENSVVLHPFNVGVSAWPDDELQKGKDNGAPHSLSMEQADVSRPDEAVNSAKGFVHGILHFPESLHASVPKVSSLLEGSSVITLSVENSDNRSQNDSSHNTSGRTGGVYEQLPWIEGNEQAETRSSIHALENAGAPANQDFASFKQEDSVGVVSDGPLLIGNADNNWKRPFGDLSVLSSTISSHDSSMPLTVSKQQTDTPAFRFAVSSKDEQTGGGNTLWGPTGREQPVSQIRSSINSNGMKPGDSKELQFSFARARNLAAFDLGETHSSISSRPLDKSYFQPALASIPAHQIPLAAAPSISTFEGEPVVSSIPAHQISLAAAPSISTFEGEPVVSSSMHDLSPAAAFSDQAKGRHDMKPVDQLAEIQKHSQNDDFAALEQHIDELTQEKYSLQRALDAARSLADSLSQQNSALTEDFNSQGAVINQLQADLEKKKEEVTSQSLVLRSFMMERERAQQENNSAVERSQILAGEVIGLEEKVLKLRSSELKLQRELETLQSENDSYRGKLAALEKDRQNLRSMLEALQEEKKLLQSQLQKKLMDDRSKTPNTNGMVQRESTDVSTSTDDLGVLDVSTQNTETTLSLFEGNVGSSQLHGTLHNTYEEASSSTMIPPLYHHLGFSMPPALATLSADDFRVINNIDTLIIELLSEKEFLLERLKKESSKAFELQALNTELSRKLEAQTQRLELVVAQNMAHGGSATVRNSNEEDQQDSYFVDEGDEVVERVLGWIMRLFPGGSSRRQTSKLL